MHTKTLGAVVACLAGLLCMALATSGDGAVGNLALPAQHTHYHHHHRNSDHPHASLITRDMQHQERFIQEPYNGPVYRCHDPHPEIFVSSLLHTLPVLQRSSLFLVDNPGLLPGSHTRFSRTYAAPMLLVAGAFFVLLGMLSTQSE